MTAESSILIAIILPLFAVPMLVMSSSRPNQRERITLVTAAVTFFVIGSLFDDVASGARPTLTLGELLPSLSITFTLEPLGMLFAGIASSLWIVTTIYAIGYMRGHHEQNQTRFFVCFAIAISSAIGIAFSGNLLTFFIFYEVLTLSTFPLVTHSGTESAKRAGRVYLGILIGTSIVFLLTAIVWTYNVTNTLDFTEGGIFGENVSVGVMATLLPLYIFGIGKAAVMPFHRWIPAAMVAPTPVSALLHAVAVVKAGVFGVLKVTIYIFGIDNLVALGSSAWIQYLAAATILVASLVALSRDNLKARLAYSTVSQLSYIVLASLLGSALGTLGGAMHIAMHAFGKITLFFCAGAIMVASHKTEISQMRGLGRKMPITFFCFLIGSLSIIGLPPFGGVWSKWYLLLGAADINEVIFILILMISSLLNVAYLIPIVIRGFYNENLEIDQEYPSKTHYTENRRLLDPGDAVANNVWRVRGFHEAPATCIGALSFTALGCVVLFFYADTLFRFLHPIVSGGAP